MPDVRRLPIEKSSTFYWPEDEGVYIEFWGGENTRFIGDGIEVDDPRQAAHQTRRRDVKRLDEALPRTLA